MTTPAPAPTPTPAAPAPAATELPPPTPAPAPPAAPAPLHDDPEIAKALEGLSEAKRELLLTTGGRNALAARAQEVKDAKAAATTAGETAKAELAQQIGKALGLVEDESVDPAKLTEQLTAEKADAKQAKTELAVFHAASGVNANAAKLLDSRAFMAKVEGLDPSDGIAIAAAIGEAVMADPTLGNGPTSRLPAPNPALGATASGAPDAQAQIEEARKSGDWKTVIALENQKLTAPANQQR